MGLPLGLHLGHPFWTVYIRFERFLVTLGVRKVMKVHLEWYTYIHTYIFIKIIRKNGYGKSGYGKHGYGNNGYAVRAKK